MAKFWTVRTVLLFGFLAFLLGFFRTFNQKKYYLGLLFCAHLYIYLYIIFIQLNIYTLTFRKPLHQHSQNCSFVHGQAASSSGTLCRHLSLTSLTRVGWLAGSGCRHLNLTSLTRVGWLAGSGWWFGNWMRGWRVAVEKIQCCWKYGLWALEVQLARTAIYLLPLIGVSW